MPNRRLKNQEDSENGLKELDKKIKIKGTLDPYTGKENLPKMDKHVKKQTMTNGLVKDVWVITKAGDPQYFVRCSNDEKVVKLIRVCRALHGVQRTCVRTLKTKRTEDRHRIKALREAGIPGFKKVIK